MKLERVERIRERRSVPIDCISIKASEIGFHVNVLDEELVHLGENMSHSMIYVDFSKDEDGNFWIGFHSFKSDDNMMKMRVSKVNGRTYYNLHYPQRYRNKDNVRLKRGFYFVKQVQEFGGVRYRKIVAAEF